MDRQASAQRRHASAHRRQGSMSNFSHSAAHASQTSAHSSHCRGARRDSRLSQEMHVPHVSAQSMQARMHSAISLLPSAQHWLAQFSHSCRHSKQASTHR